jgi:hypothetical protein
MNLFNNFFKKGLVVYKSNAWLSRQKYNTKLAKFKSEFKEFAYEALIYLNSPRGNFIKIVVYAYSFAFAFNYMRRKFFNRDRKLGHTSIEVHTEAMKKDINPPKDATDANNYNRLHYSREYTLKY